MHADDATRVLSGEASNGRASVARPPGYGVYGLEIGLDPRTAARVGARYCVHDRRGGGFWYFLHLTDVILNAIQCGGKCSCGWKQLGDVEEKH